MMPPAASTGFAAFAGGVAPSYDGRGLANVAPTILRHYGIPTGRIPLSPEALPVPLDGVERIVLVVVDGLGWEQYLRAPVARRARGARPITSVLPSTTASALATLATGASPAEHGILGYRTHLPRVGAIVNMIRLQPYYAHRTLFDFGVTPEAFFPFDTLGGRLAGAGVATRVVTRSSYTESPLSRMIYRGVAPEGFVGLADLLEHADRFLAETRGGRAFLELYWDEVDTTAHRYGPGSREEAAAGRLFLDAVAAALAPHLDDGRTLALVTADHGHVHVPRDRVLNLNDEPEILRELVLPPTGEGRLAYLHVRDGARAHVRRALADAWGDAVTVMDAEDAVAAGAFGPPPHHPELLQRLGSLVVVPEGNRKVEYQATPATGSHPLLGNHGGVHAEEMLVPLAAL